MNELGEELKTRKSTPNVLERVGRLLNGCVARSVYYATN